MYDSDDRIADEVKEAYTFYSKIIFRQFVFADFFPQGNV